MLLTSGQVSVAISSFIVFFFTTALFLSGYVLQQQTVRDLREAIKPQFQAKLVGLEVSNNLNMNADRSGRKGQVEVFLPKKFEVEEERGDDVKVGIKRDMEAEWDGVIGERKKVEKTRSGKTKDWSGIEERLIEPQKKHGVEEEEDPESINDTGSIAREEREITVPEKPLSRAERRRKIKEDLLTSGEGETFTGYRRRVPGV
ncbi:06616969-dc82-45e5-bbda-a10a6bc0e2a4 [Sclerotinia trifoliorum]|uniref:06616969-dc82-45e5-bbda-a10a6bc0e2a4 n=1 Tax=Sclerotinia trifoliorum TaxID=28548 RepID=A0A8H2ZP30_9HELO|nr:06616969-dc82-45e5-bbda-a10a6bc0e2a4 [Sclerotinia trifoliorum]